MKHYILEWHPAGSECGCTHLSAENDEEASEIADKFLGHFGTMFHSYSLTDLKNGEEIWPRPKRRKG